jgi:transposase
LELLQLKGIAKSLDEDCLPNRTRVSEKPGRRVLPCLQAPGLLEGERQAAVAAFLKVSRQSVSRWYHDWINKDTKALQGANRAGRKRRLSKGQLSQVQSELFKGAMAHGYSSDLWTLPRVAQVIETTTAVRYHPGHVWRVLRQMGWSLQRPTLRAKERHEQKIRHWKNRTWAKVRKAPKSGELG